MHLLNDDGSRTSSLNEAGDELFAKWFQKDDSVNDNMFHSDVRQQVKNFVRNVTFGEDDINADVLEDAINSLKSMKDPGPDGILDLVLKNINVRKPTFLKIINACLNLCCFPKEWKKII